MKRLRIAAIIALTGCASATEVVPYGQGQYIVGASDSSGTATRGVLQVKAAEAANAHCAGMGKAMKVEDTKAPGTANASSALVFSCIQK